jgi:single-stranded-DNA-specific exonuclease
LINPNIKSCGYPESRLCGAGVVFKYISAIMSWQDKIDTPIKLPQGYDKWLLDLVAIATVGDIVPLVKENRVFVKYGLVVLSKTRNPGLEKLMATINNRNGQIDSEYIGWRLVPRINAAGRIDHASAAFYLLTSKDEAEIDRWITMLEDNNRYRQQITETIMRQAEAQLKDFDESDKSIIVIGEDWPAGVVGLVAGRLSDKYHRPVLVFTKGQNNSSTAENEIKFVASGRSISEFDITAALKQCDGLLARYGGHPQACGLTIIGQDKFDEFLKKFKSIAEDKLADSELIPVLKIDAEIKLSQITWELLSELAKFEPYGEANEKPLFATRQLNIEQVQTVGADGKHLKVLVSQDGDIKNVHKLIGFSFGNWCAKLQAGDKIDIVFELGVNEWNGNRELQLKIVDLKLSE